MVTLYTTHCPRCNVLMQKLEAEDIPYDIVEDKEIIKSKGIMSVPMLEVDGKLMNFVQAVNWVNEEA